MDRGKEAFWDATSVATRHRPPANVKGEEGGWGAWEKGGKKGVTNWEFNLLVKTGNIAMKKEESCGQPQRGVSV